MLPADDDEYADARGIEESACMHKCMWYLKRLQPPIRSTIVDSVPTDENECKYYIFGEKYNKNMKYSALQSICTARRMLGGERKGRRVNFIYSYDKRLYT